jgi:predicted nuclease with RNAse H fold
MNHDDTSPAEPAIFLGIDVAGQKKTFVAGLSSSERGYKLVLPPEIMTLEQIRDYCRDHNVLGVAIDAQLTADLKENNGFRYGDRMLQGYLPKSCSNWVQSANCLYAVPARGRLLADHLAPLVGTIIETHPRASLLFALGLDSLVDIKKYKPRPRQTPIQRDACKESALSLWRSWTNRYHIQCEKDFRSDDELDALVCASVVALLHAHPKQLWRVPSQAEHPVGRGPLYVIRPDKKYLRRLRAYR